MVIAVAALAEIVTGLALLTFPGVFVRLVFGADATGVVITLGRMTGFGLLALGLACWPERGARLSAPALRGLLTYNALITARMFGVPGDQLRLSRSPFSRSPGSPSRWACGARARTGSRLS
jgi:hypothetical protein